MQGLIPILTLTLTLAFACNSEEAGQNKSSGSNACLASFSFSSESIDQQSRVAVVGDLNDWSPQSYYLEWDEKSERFQGSFGIGPGRYAYRFLLDDGSEVLDNNNPLTVYGRDGREHSYLIQRDCHTPYGELEMTSQEDGVLKVLLKTAYQEKATVNLSVQLDGLDVDSESSWVSESNMEIVLTAPSIPGKHRLEITLKDADGKSSSAELVFNTNDDSFRWEDAIIYQIVTDRFQRGTGEGLQTDKPLTHRMGGDYSGISYAIEQGYFNALSVNTLWISPAYTNASGEWEGFDGRVYESYHGYWPVAARDVDPLWGGEAALKSLVETAHVSSMKMILDIVPNHTHIEHPYFKEHADTWFNHPNGDCICGRQCDWGTDIEHCWFTDYLPDLNWKNEDVLETIIGDSVWWMDHFDLDGLRVDAVAMMPRLVTRHLRYEIERKLGKAQVRPYLIGETFTGNDGRDDIRWYLGPYGLSGQFDFPLMWTVRYVIAEGQGRMDTLLDEADKSMAAWEGSGAVMGLMLGNHDVPRFLSVAAGDEVSNPLNPPQQPTKANPYKLMAVSHAFLMTQHGAVILYYGDEYGMAGAGDPDNRRPMLFSEALNDQQQKLHANVKKLTGLRSALYSWRYGERVDLLREKDAIAYLLHSEQDRSIVLLSRSSKALTFDIPLPDVDENTAWYANLEDCYGSKSTFSLSEKLLHVTLEPYAIMALTEKNICDAI